MDLNILGLFASVAKAGSYAAVARDRSIDPSSISRMISALEKEMGVRLFQRSTRQVKLTEAG
ncbi:MAG: LysR family transcriptional regulator, partial [Burkholderiaceae bacterium]|nr:LysR family transcriptional regulator [Burkholderiaceae bacterium]